VTVTTSTGTGKSTVIFHLVHSFIPLDYLTLATCVQNKAVDAIASKLASDGLLTFFVYGNEKRLSLLAKQYTVSAQVERDEGVLELNAQLGNLQYKVGLLASNCTKLLRRFIGSPTYMKCREEKRSRRSLLIFPVSMVKRKDGTGEDENMVKRLNWMSRDLWKTWYEKYTLSKYAGAFQDLKSYNKLTDMCREALFHKMAEVRLHLLQTSRVVLCTVATASSHRFLTDKELQDIVIPRIKAVVLDEAGTCPEAKIPLLATLQNVDRIIAIGDQKQLSPFTYFQGASAGLCFDFAKGKCHRGSSCRYSHGSNSQSSTGPVGYFQRIEKALPPNAIAMLKKQYRMHPDIADYISAQFYEGKLKSDSSTSAARKRASESGIYWLLYPSHESCCEKAPVGRKSSSKCNPFECTSIVNLLSAPSVVGRHEMRKSVMVMTFYKAQEDLLRSTLSDAGISEDPEYLRVLTVDQSQGSEADVVIISCVRSNLDGTVGFLENPNRMNVAISRARERLIIVGDQNTLMKDVKFKGLLVAANRVEEVHEISDLK
jgi:hypothetical protein